MNVDGYYDSLLSFIDLAVDEEFISRNARRIIVSAASAKELVRKLEVVNNEMFSKRLGLLLTIAQSFNHGLICI